MPFFHDRRSRAVPCAAALAAAFASAAACTGTTKNETTSADDAGSTQQAGSDAAASANSIASDALSPDAGAPNVKLTAREKELVDMPADTFLKVPAGYRAACDDSGEWHLVSGCEGLLSAWSSGAYDPLHHQMLLFGGGHMDYGGNEVYAFDVKSFAWSRLTAPSLGPYDIDPLNDGRPVSRHTYDGLTWIEQTATMMAWGGSRATSGGGTNVTWFFDPATKQWKNPPVIDVPGGAYDLSLVYDPITNKVFEKGGEAFNVFDVATSTWKKVRDFGFPPYWPRYSGGSPRGILDTKRRVVWSVGGGLYMLYAIDTDEFVTDKWVTTGGGDFDNSSAVNGRTEQVITTGGGDVIGAKAPGLDYDVKADALVAWTGGAPYVLDLTTKTWTRKSGAGDLPPGPTGTGTYGRFRYLREYNVFLLVTSSDAVYFYKHTAGGP